MSRWRRTVWPWRGCRRGCFIVPLVYFHAGDEHKWEFSNRNFCSLFLAKRNEERGNESLVKWLEIPLFTRSHFSDSIIVQKCPESARLQGFWAVILCVGMLAYATHRSVTEKTSKLKYRDLKTAYATAVGSPRWYGPVSVEVLLSPGRPRIDSR